MADIDIVPKKRTGTAWLWIVLAIIAVVLIMWMMAGRSAPRTTGGAAVAYPFATIPMLSSPVTT
jgi:bacteriorhodopsin